MPTDEKEFFREATLRICGSLEIEKSADQAAQCRYLLRTNRETFVGRDRTSSLAVMG